MVNSVLSSQVPIYGITRQQSLPSRPSRKRPRHRQSPNNSNSVRPIQGGPHSGVASSTSRNTLSEAAITESAVSVFENWLLNYPSIPIPSEAHFGALAVLTGLRVETVKMWFGQKLRQGRMGDSSASAASQTMNSLSIQDRGLSQIHTPKPELLLQQSILRRAALWVRDEKGIRCSAVLDLTVLLRDDDRPYQCTLKCGQTFDRKDDWRKHEEINYPQEGWLCDVKAVLIQASAPICTFCGVRNPGRNHMQQKHPRKTPCHEKLLTDQGRLSYRKDKFRQHFTNTHPKLEWDDHHERSHFVVKSKFPRGCGFCAHRFIDWQDRIKHIGDHFASCTEARDMTQWQEPHEEDEADVQDQDDNDDDENQDENQDQHGDKGRRDDRGPDKDDAMSDSSFDDSDDHPPESAPAQRGQFNFGTTMSAQCIDEIHPVIPFSAGPLPIERYVTQDQRTRASSFNGSDFKSLWCGSIRLDSSQSQLIRTKVLGFGPYSVVDEVHHQKTGLTLARKTIHYSSQSSLKSLIAEVDIMKRLNHPHIVRFVGTYVFDHSFSILMTPSADFDLRYFMETHVGNEGPGMDTVIQWFSCLVSSVQYLHSNSIKHQDIKPSNILIRGRIIFLADFGIAKTFVDSESTTSTSGNMTRKYCSPETANQGLRGRGSDIFSLGCVFVEMLSFLLYDGDTRFRDFQKTHFVGDGAFHENLTVIGDWMHLLQAHSAITSQPYLRRVLDACEAMLEENPGDRPTARSLATLFIPGECCFFPELLPQSTKIPRHLISTGSHMEGEIRQDSQSPLPVALQISHAESNDSSALEGYSLRQYLENPDCMEVLRLRFAGLLWNQTTLVDEAGCWLNARFNWVFHSAQY
jgi:serine/threonine protein kinase